MSLTKVTYSMIESAPINVLDFGYVGDGVTDDTQAWRNAIAFAGAQKVRTIIKPAGVSIVTGQICNGSNLLPPGLQFVGAAPVGTTSSQPNELRYTGSGICWDVKYTTGAPLSTGSWTWDGIDFECTNSAATMFDFGDTTTHTPDGDPNVDPYQFLLGINFKNCQAIGGRGAGDFLRVCKGLAVDIDETVSIRAWRRGVWLKGTDNSTIRARMFDNNRSVQIDRMNFLGNNNKILSHFIGGVDPNNGGGAAFGGETRHLIYDSGLSTIVGEMLMEDTVDSYIYFDGYGTVVYSPILSSVMPFFNLSPNAQECVIYSPRVTITNAGFAPTIQAPTSWNFAAQGSDYRIRIIDAPQTIQAILPLHPRIIQTGQKRNAARNQVAQGTVAQAANGVLQTPLIWTAYDNWAVQASPGGGGIKAIVQDSTIGNRYVAQLTKDTPNEQSIVLQYRMGQDIQQGLYQLVHRIRLASGVSDAGWAFIVAVNGVFLYGSYPVASTTSYTTTRIAVDLSAVTLGDIVSINLYNSSAGATGVDIFVDALGFEPVLQTGWTTGTGTANKGAFAATASAGYVQAEALSVAQRVLALEQAMRANGQIN